MRRSVAFAAVVGVWSVLLPSATAFARQVMTAEEIAEEEARAAAERAAREAPRAEVSPQSVDAALTEGDTAGVTLRIRNAGRGVLAWEVRSSPSWALASVREGTVAAGQSVEVRVLLLGQGLSRGRWKGELVLETSDPSRAALVIPIAVSVAAPMTVETLSTPPVPPETTYRPPRAPPLERRWDGRNDWSFWFLEGLLFSDGSDAPIMSVARRYEHNGQQFEIGAEYYGRWKHVEGEYSDTYSHRSALNLHWGVRKPYEKRYAGVAFTVGGFVEFADLHYDYYDYHPYTEFEDERSVVSLGGFASAAARWRNFRIRVIGRLGFDLADLPSRHLGPSCLGLGGCLLGWEW